MARNYNFAPAAPDEPYVYGACRPCHRRAPAHSTLEDWIGFMQDRGIERVCCLLDEKRDQYHDLLGAYHAAFGDEAVCHAPIEDHSAVDEDLFYGQILPFLRGAVADETPVVVHCSAGLGRTGQVLVGWLVHGRDYDFEAAIDTVREQGRHPTEAVSDATIRKWVCQPETPRAQIDSPALFEGMGASPGFATGPVRHIGPYDRTDVNPPAAGSADPDDIADGDVVVTPELRVAVQDAFDRMAAVITYDAPGQMTGKAAVVAREKGFPAVVDCPTAVSKLEEETTLTVDGYFGAVYPRDQ